MQAELEPSAQTAPESRAAPRSFSHRWFTPLLLTAFSIFYFTDVLLRASAKYFWFDEIFTLYLSRLSPGELWTALEAAVDNNPPLFYWFTKAGIALAGENRIGLRLPEVIAFWVFCLCAFWFVNRRAGVVAGFIAMVFPLFTGAFFYAYDARPHGIVLGFAGLCVICWEKVQQGGRRRGLWLVLMSLVLFAAFMNHCYAVVLVIPFALVELFNTATARRPDAGVWAALVLPVLAVVPVYLPLLRGVHQLLQGTMHASVFPANWQQVARFYHFLLDPAFLMVLTAFAFAFIGTFVGGPRPIVVAVRDFVLALGFLALPAAGVVLGKAVHAPYVYRYFLSALLGVVFLLAVLFRGYALSRRNLIGLAFATVLAVYWMYSFSHLLWRHAAHRLYYPYTSIALDTTPGRPLANESLLFSATDTSIPIGTQDEDRFLRVAYYSPELSRRLYHFSKPELEHEYRLLQRFERWGPPYNPPETYNEFFGAHPRCYIYGGDEIVDIVSDLMRQGWRLTSLQMFEGQSLAMVEHAATSAPRAGTDRHAVQ